MTGARAAFDIFDVLAGCLLGFYSGAALCLSTTPLAAGSVAVGAVIANPSRIRGTESPHSD